MAELSKERILRALDDLPDDATVEQAIERLYLLAKIEKGVGQLGDGQGIEHEDIKQRYTKGDADIEALWLDEAAQRNAELEERGGDSIPAEDALREARARLRGLGP